MTYLCVKHPDVRRFREKTMHEMGEIHRAYRFQACLSPLDNTPVAFGTSVFESAMNPEVALPVQQYRRGQKSGYSPPKRHHARDPRATNATKHSAPRDQHETQAGQFPFIAGAIVAPGRHERK